MESKTKEYQENYKIFEKRLDEVWESEKRADRIKDEIRQLEEQQKQFDFNDGNVVVPCMENRMQNAIAKEKENIAKRTEKALSCVTADNKKVWKNCREVKKMLPPKQIRKILDTSPVDAHVEVEEWTLSYAEKASAFHACFILNKICSFVFRFEFLQFLPKVEMLPKAARILIGVILWGLIFFLKGGSVAAGLALLANIAAYLAACLKAKKYILDNHLVYRAQQNPEKLKEDLYNAWFAEFTEEKVTGWEAEIENIKNNGINGGKESEENSLYCLARNDLQKEFMEYQNDIDQENEMLKQAQEEYKEASNRLDDVKKELQELEKVMADPKLIVTESEHNQGVLTPSVPIGFSIWGEKHEVKRLSAINHKYHPVLIYYSDKTADNLKKFQRNMAHLMELLIKGFMHENYRGIMDAKLIDFVGLSSSVLNRSMKVCKKQQELQNLYQELEESEEFLYRQLEENSELSDRFAKEKFAGINPKRLSERENPMKYHIVFFVGEDFSAVDKETSRLFKVSESFGFLPFIFMKKSEMDDLLSGNGKNKPFSDVIKMMKESGQIYEFEKLVDDFLEMDIVISNRKELMQERLYAKRIWSLSEFFDALKGANTVKATGFLYVDAKNLTEEDYNYCESITRVNSGEKSVKYLALEDEDIPEFVNKDENKKNDRIKIIGL